MDDHTTALVNKVSVSRGDINKQQQYHRNSCRRVVTALMPMGRFSVVIAAEKAAELAPAKMCYGYTCGRGDSKTSITTRPFSAARSCGVTSRNRWRRLAMATEAMIALLRMSTKIKADDDDKNGESCSIYILVLKVICVKVFT
jgi:hypothetical protein